MTDSFKMDADFAADATIRIACACGQAHDLTLPGGKVVVTQCPCGRALVLVSNIVTDTDTAAAVLGAPTMTGVRQYAAQLHVLNGPPAHVAVLVTWHLQRRQRARENGTDGRLA